MIRHRMLTNASLRVSESKVTHAMTEIRLDNARVCQGCGILRSLISHPGPAQKASHRAAPATHQRSRAAPVPAPG
jgi:hypothetical protein